MRVAGRAMNRTKANKEKERYYLLAGMGGTAARKKHRTTLIWSALAALAVAAVMALVFLYIDRMRMG